MHPSIPYYTIDMKLKELQKSWDRFGREDPLWAVLTEPDKKGGKWDREEFFKTGAREISALLQSLGAARIDFPKKTALDFGCGVGRLTQALAVYFDLVYGVDIAPAMVEQARQYNQTGDKCRFFLNKSANLSLFSDNSFDFIYSNITLQHMPPAYSKLYIKEFLRLVTSGGLVVFQLPGEPKHSRPRPINRLESILRDFAPVSLLTLYFKARYKVDYKPVMRMYGMGKKAVIEFLQKNQARIIEIRENRSAGPHWPSYQYCVKK